MVSGSPAAQSVPSLDELEELFRSAEKPPAEHRIGAEAEKFAVLADTAQPLPYPGERSVLAVLSRLEKDAGWALEAEKPGGPLIALRRGKAAITLEPGGQLELSGSPHAQLHAVAAELEEHFEELGALSEGLGLRWLSLGFHPLASLGELPLVPKERYSVMKRYLPTRGRRGRDMMQRTATVQANFDFSSERDAMRKLRVLLAVSPVVQAMCACAPFYEGRVSGLLSERLDVWLHMDPTRSGLLPALWEPAEPRYAHYVQWALDAGMFFIKRAGEVVANTGQTFRQFLTDGYQGHRATLGDWAWHLGTLFPEVRLKTTLEARSCDAMPRALLPAVPALLTGLLYDATALAAVEALAERLTFEQANEARLRVPASGLRTVLGGRPLLGWAEQLLEIAAGGLVRRARLDSQGRDESRLLAPLAALVSSGRTPAEAVVGAAPVGSPVTEEQLRRLDASSSDFL